MGTLQNLYQIRHMTGHRRLKALADGVPPRHKLRAVIEYIMENLGGSPALEHGGRRPSQPLSLRATVFGIPQEADKVRKIIKDS